MRDLGWHPVITSSTLGQNTATVVFMLTPRLRIITRG
jgi:hypothetical protein